MHDRTEYASPRGYLTQSKYSPELLTRRFSEPHIRQSEGDDEKRAQAIDAIWARLHARCEQCAELSAA